VVFINTTVSLPRGKHVVDINFLKRRHWVEEEEKEEENHLRKHAVKQKENREKKKISFLLFI